MKVFMVPLTGGNTGQKPAPIPIPLGTTTTLGRGPLLKITDDRVSRRQAEITVSGDGLYVKLTSTGLNPSYVLPKGESKPVRLDASNTLTVYTGDQVWLIGIHKYQFLQVPEAGDPQPPVRASPLTSPDDDYDDDYGDDYGDDYEDDVYGAAPPPVPPRAHKSSGRGAPEPPPRQRKASTGGAKTRSGRSGSKAKAAKGPPPVPARAHMERKASKASMSGRKGSPRKDKKKEEERRKEEEKRAKEREKERKRIEAAERKAKEAEEAAMEALRSALEDAISSGSPDELEEAIADAKGTLPKKEIKEAEEALDAAYQDISDTTLAALAESEKGDDVWVFKDCLDKAKKLKKYGLTSEDRNYYEDQLEQWKKQAKVIKAIEAAKKQGHNGIDKMKKALKEAKSVQAEVGGLEEHIKYAEESLEEMQEAKKKAELQNAMFAGINKNRAAFAMTGRFEDAVLPDDDANDW